MNIEQRKVQLAQSVLRLKDEQLLKKVEQILREERINAQFVPMTVEELQSRIELSEQEFDQGEFVLASDLLKKYR